MTIDQQEQHILSLMYKLPLLRRLKLALTVLQGVDPEDVSVQAKNWESDSFFNELDQRYEDMITGKDKGISPDDLFNQIDSGLK